MASWNTEIETKDNKVIITSGDRSNSYYGKFWVAQLTGLDSKWGFTRNFINNKEDAIIREDGFFQVFRTCQWAKRDEKYFVIVKNGQFTIVEKNDIIEAIENKDSKIDRKSIMKRAHEIAKSLEGQYSARLSFAMKQAWSEAR